MKRSIKGLIKEKMTAIFINRLKTSSDLSSFGRNIELISDNIDLFVDIQIKAILKALSSVEMQKLVHSNRSAGDNIAKMFF